mgnify:FL=1
MFEPIRKGVKQSALTLEESPHYIMAVKAYGKEGVNHYLSVANNLQRFKLGHLALPALYHGLNLLPNRDFANKIIQNLSQRERQIIRQYNQLPKMAKTRESDPEHLTYLLEKSGESNLDLFMLRAADRLERMNDPKSKSEYRNAAAIASIKYYVPLLKLINHYQFATELEDMAVKTLHPDLYDRTKKLVELEKSKTIGIEKFGEDLRGIASELGIGAQVQVSTKSIGSILRKAYPKTSLLKMKETERQYSNSKLKGHLLGMRDLVRARVIVPNTTGPIRLPYYDQYMIELHRR